MFGKQSAGSAMLSALMVLLFISLGLHVQVDAIRANSANGSQLAAILDAEREGVQIQHSLYQLIQALIQDQPFLPLAQSIGLDAEQVASLQHFLNEPIPVDAPPTKCVNQPTLSQWMVQFQRTTPINPNNNIAVTVGLNHISRDACSLAIGGEPQQCDYILQVVVCASTARVNRRVLVEEQWRYRAAHQQDNSV